MSVATSSIAELYIAYFNRAPEPLGYDFWCDVLDNPVTLAEIASDFATQPEAVAMYPLLEARTTDSLGDFLTTVYQNLFDRDPDAAGLEFWTGVIQGGADLGTILLEIINGASDEDRAVLEAKAGIAEYWVEAARIAPGYELTDTAIAASREAIEAAGTDAEAGTAIADAYFAPAAQVELTTVENDVRPGVLLTTPLKVADIAVTGDDPEEDDTVLGLTGTDADQFEIVGTELFLKAGGIVQFGSDKMMDVVVTLDDTRTGHFRMDGAESGAGLTLTQADIPVEGAPDFVWDGDDEFVINEFFQNNQNFSSVTVLADGNFVVVWQSSDGQQGDISGTAIKGRIFGPDGNPESDEFLVNEFTQSAQVNTSVKALPDGNFVVVWESEDGQQGDISGTAIKGRIFAPDGDPESDEFLVNEFPQNSQGFPAVTTLSNGDFVVTWQSNDGQQGDSSGTAIKGRVFAPDGDPESDEFLVNEFPQGSQFRAAVTVLADGKFVVAWYSNDGQDDDTSSTAIKGRIFASDGAPESDEFLINEFLENNQANPAITTLDNGSFVVTWDSRDQQQDDIEDYAIKARVFSADGDPISDEILVNEFPDNDQFDPAITSLGNGRFAITWYSTDEQQDDTSGLAVKMRIFAADGTPESDEVLVNEFVLNDQDSGAIAAFADGSFVITFDSRDPFQEDFSGSSIKGRIFEIDGNNDATVQRVVADLNPDADFTYDPAEMVGIPVEPDGGIV